MQRNLPTPTTRRASRRVATLAAAGALAWLAACDRTPEVTAPPSASPLSASVPGLAGRMDPVALDLVEGQECMPDLSSTLAADGALPRGATFAASVPAGPMTSTTGVSLYNLDTPVPGAGSAGVDINNSGLAAVNVNVGGGRAYAWTLAGGFVLIPSLAGAASMHATDLNNGGTIVGYANMTDGSIASWRWTAGGGTSQIAGPANLQVRGINDAGWMSGSVGLPGSESAVKNVGAGWVSIGSAPSSGWAINALGAVAGYIGLGTAQRATYWPASGPYVNIGVVPVSVASRAYGLNDLGQVVGETIRFDANGNPLPFPMYWSGSGAPVLITGAGFSGPPASARDINNAGLVAGYGWSTTLNDRVIAWTWQAPSGPLTKLGKRTDACSSLIFGLNDVCQAVGYNLIPPTPGLPTAAMFNLPGCTAPTGQLGNYTWIDANGNGRQDAGEPVLNGVVLTLSGTQSGTQTSSGGGLYLFTGLTLGSYTVTATPPAGWVATTPLVVNITTNPTNDSNNNPTSTAISLAALSDLTLDFGFVQQAGSGQGCTPGYWKQAQHFPSWKWYAPTDMVNTVFGVNFSSLLKNNPSGPLTLLQGLELNGNDGGEALVRHGVAALLNSVYQSGVSFPYTAPQVIQMVQTAINSGQFSQMEAAHQLLRAANESVCPLN